MKYKTRKINKLSSIIPILFYFILIFNVMIFKHWFADLT